VKLCIDCASYGGVAAATGRYVCNDPRNLFTHPVDGLEHRYDASWLRMSPEFQTAFCGMEGKWWKQKPRDEA